MARKSSAARKPVSFKTSDGRTISFKAKTKTAKNSNLSDTQLREKMKSKGMSKKFIDHMIDVRNGKKIKPKSRKSRPRTSRKMRGG